MTPPLPSPKSLSPPYPTPRAAPLRYIALGLILTPFLIRATSTFNPLPGWDLDPLVLSAPISGLGPAASLSCDVVALLGCAILIWTEFRTRRPDFSDLLTLALIAIGAAAILTHAVIATPVPPINPNPDGSAWSWVRGITLGNARIGASWLSAITAAASISIARRDESLRRVVFALLVGFVVLLALRGAQQVFIEHPQTVADYRADRDRFLASHGWTTDSPSARSFERRLLQPEAYGWFALSNVYATFAAAGLVGLTVLAFTLWKSPPTHPRDRSFRTTTTITTLGALAAAAALYLSASKGGYLAALGGFSAAALLILAHSLLSRRASNDHAALERRTRTIGAIVGLAAIVAPLALICARGMIGERVGELSLLFRWFYLQGAARIFSFSPWLGVGPDGFQSAYLLAKNPLSPEDVTSPHNLLFDWLSTLGLAGLSWCALLAWWSARAGASALSPRRTITTDPQATTPLDRDELRAAVLIPAIATVAAAWIHGPLTTIDTALVRILGLAAWVVVSCSILRACANLPSWTLAASAAALATIAHAQIDVTGSWPASVSLLLPLIACASGCRICLHSRWGRLLACPPPDHTTAAQRTRLIPAIFASAPIIAIAATILTLAALPAYRWENALKRASERLRPIADLGVELRNLVPTSGAAPQPDIQAWLNRLSAAIAEASGKPARPVHWDQASVKAAFAELHTHLVPKSVADLQSAAQIFPDQWRLRRELANLNLSLAAALRATGDAPAADRATAAAISSFSVTEDPDTIHQTRPNSGELRAASLALEASAADQTGDARNASLAHAIRLLEAAAALDPSSPDLALRLFTLCESAGRAPDAARWARRAIELDDLARLDRLGRGLAPEVRLKAERAASAPK